MYKRILIACDFDKVGHHACRVGLSIAKQYSGTLYLVHVMDLMPAYAYPGFAGFAEVEEPLKEHAREETRRIAEELNVPEAQCFLEVGSTKNEVLRLAKELKIDLIVAGSHGKHGLASLLGSTSNAILHGAHCDVLVVHGDGTSTHGDGTSKE